MTPAQRKAAALAVHLRHGEGLLINLPFSSFGSILRSLLTGVVAAFSILHFPPEILLCMTETGTLFSSANCAKDFVGETMWTILLCRA